MLNGRTVEHVEFGLARLERWAPRLTGARVESVSSHGKAMLTRFDSGQVLYSHNQLYGRWFVCPRGRLPETGRSLRVGLHTATHSALLYSASEIEVLNPEELGQHPFLGKLGPDLLDPKLDARAIRRRLEEPRFRRRSLGALYLDQSFLAGLGNYLRSEILFSAGLHPALRPCDLERGQAQGLARQTLAVAWRSYRTGGVTLTAAARPARGGRGRKRERFWVFGRGGRPCRRCSAAVRRIAVGGRRLYLCPSCQDGG